MKIKHIIVAGPESSGKTTLSKQLAKALNGVWIPEYPRGYLEAAERRAVYDDFDHFVEVNIHLVYAAKAKLKKREEVQKVVIQDTGLETLKLWAQDKFDLVNLTVETAFSVQRPDLYLLCLPDLPWEYDALREDANRREYLFQRLSEILAGQEGAVAEISGVGNDRFTKALEAIRTLD